MRTGLFLAAHGFCPFTAHHFASLPCAHAGNDMFMDLGEEIRLKVRAVRFNTPPTPAQLAAATGEDALVGTAAKPFVPMEVVGDINGDGLGLLSWWAPAEEDGDGMEDEG